MIRKVYSMKNLGCANCAAKMEEKFRNHEAVQDAVITFSTRQLRLTAEDPDALIPELTRIARTVEGDVEILPKEEKHQVQEHSCCCGQSHADAGTCGCGHHNQEEPSECGCHGHSRGCGNHEGECHCGHDHHPGEENNGNVLLMGAGLFAAGLWLASAGYGMFSLLVCLGAYVLLGRDVVKAAVQNLIKGHVFDENFLMSIATIGAFLIGEYPEAVGVMLFYRVGEYFEHRAVERSRKQIMDAVDLRPEVVLLVEEEDIIPIPAADAKVGDLLLVRPGDRIPLDGMVVKGESRIDTAPITGEPVPVRVMEGDRVTSGCVNTVGQLTILVEIRCRNPW